MNSNAPASKSAQEARERVVVVQPERSRFTLCLKRLSQWAFMAWVSPRLLAYRVGQAVWGKRQAFLFASESIGRIPGMRGVYARQAFYRSTLRACGQDVYVGWQSVFSMPQAAIGDGVYIGRRCGIGFASIGDGVMLADGVQILSGGREHGRATRDGETHQGQPQEFARLEIGAGAWIGTNAIIMADVGAGAIIGAGAVVNELIPAHSVAVGVPAKVVKALA